MHYKNPAFDDKRLWVCRLLAQFVTDGALVISVDESHLRSDGAKQFRWQFHGRENEFKHFLSRSVAKQSFAQRAALARNPLGHSGRHPPGAREDVRAERYPVRVQSEWGDISSELS